MTPAGRPVPDRDTGEPERRYRRLLAWYPTDYRQEHEDEMVGVLLADSRGRRRPGARDIADLLLGALRIRARHAIRSFSNSVAADALAVVSLLVPALLLAGAASGLQEIGWWLKNDGLSFGFLNTFPHAPGWAAWLVAGVLGLLGWRRSAAAAACVAAVALTVVLTVHLGNDLYPTQEAPWVLLGWLGAVAAVASRGARHGLTVLGGRRYAAVLAASGLVVATHLFGRDPDSTFAAVPWLLPFVVVLACRPATRVGRRALALLALPGFAYVLTLAGATDRSTVRYAVPAMAAGVLWCLLWIASRQRRAGTGLGGYSER